MSLDGVIEAPTWTFPGGASPCDFSPAACESYENGVACLAYRPTP